MIHRRPCESPPQRIPERLPDWAGPAIRCNGFRHKQFSGGYFGKQTSHKRVTAWHAVINVTDSIDEGIALCHFRESEKLFRQIQASFEHFGMQRGWSGIGKLRIIWYSFLVFKERSGFENLSSESETCLQGRADDILDAISRELFGFPVSLANFRPSDGIGTTRFDIVPSQDAVG